jgi:hypothetical protein
MNFYFHQNDVLKSDSFVSKANKLILYGKITPL